MNIFLKGLTTLDVCLEDRLEDSIFRLQKLVIGSNVASSLYHVSIAVGKVNTFW